MTDQKKVEREGAGVAETTGYLETGSGAACTASLVTGLTGESPVGVILSLTP